MVNPRVIAFTFLCACSPANSETEQTETYPSGVVSRRIRLVNGVKEGMMTDYYPDGRVMAERMFHLDRQHGKTVIYYPSGALKEVQYYDLGKQCQGDTLWYENGSIQFSVQFRNNLKDGYMRKWNTEGKLIFEARYVNDTLAEVSGRMLE